MKTVITKQRLKELDACVDGYKTFVEANGESAKLSKALESNGWDDIWWYISEDYSEFSEKQKKDFHLLGCDWAESCLQNFEKEYPEDNRPRKAIQAKRDFLKGKISEDELKDAWSAAESAGRTADMSAAMSAMSDDLMKLFLKWEQDK